MSNQPKSDVIVQGCYVCVLGYDKQLEFFLATLILGEWFLHPSTTAYLRGAKTSANNESLSCNFVSKCQRMHDEMLEKSWAN